MNRKFLVLIGAVVCAHSASIKPACAQGTAFTYQGRLNDGVNPANGVYDLRFTVYDSGVGGGQQGPILTNSATGVTNGLFTVALDFGNQFSGADRWLEIGVRTNGGGSFVALSPRQKLTPAPYAIFAGGASAAGLSGTVGNGQLANSSVTVNAGIGLGGGGVVPLGGSTTLNNAGVLSVTGNADITANTIAGAVTLGDTATSADTPGTLVKRDANGDFSAGTIALKTNLNLPATTATAGIIYSGGTTLLHAYGTANFFGGPGAGNLTLTGNGNTALGFDAFHSNQNGNENTANGAQALLNNTSGSDNTANGYSALFSNTGGSNNTANGAYALVLNTGSDNTANGYQSLYNNHSSSFNTASGSQALYHNTNGQDNIAVGHWALYYNQSDGNVALGSLALYENDLTRNDQGQGIPYIASDYNTAIGYSALQNLGGSTEAQQMLGGANNIALGAYAGNLLKDGTNNIYIGSYGSDEENETIRIGNVQTSTFIAGIFGETTAGGTAVYVNSSGQLGTLTSSARYKQDICSMGDSSEVLLSLRPVTFQYKPEIDPRGMPQFGLVAEEVDKVDPDLVVRDGKGEIYSVRYEAVNAMLLNEFLKQHRKVEEQANEIQDQNAEIQTLKRKAARMDSLEEQLHELQASVKSLTERN